VELTPAQTKFNEDTVHILGLIIDGVNRGAMRVRYTPLISLGEHIPPSPHEKVGTFKPSGNKMFIFSTGDELETLAGMEHHVKLRRAELEKEAQEAAEKSLGHG